MLMARAAVSAVMLISVLVVATSAASGVATSAPRLTRDVPDVVQRVCASGQPSSPLPLVCPPLVPLTRYRTHPGLNGVLLGNTSTPPVRPPADRLYLLGFNGGDSGPTYWHWMAGMGTPAAIQYWILSDARNVVRGKPTRVRTVVVDGRRVEIWRFPDHPAGGQFGGHYAAITTSGRLRAIASVHGDHPQESARMAVALAQKAASQPGSGARSLARFDRDGIAFRYPRPWFLTTQPLSNGINPKYRFAVSSVPVRRTSEDLGPCLAGIAKQLPADAALVYLREALGTDRTSSLPRLQPRPRSIRLPAQADNSLPCFGPGGRWIPFRSGGRAFYLGLYLGPKAPPGIAQTLRRLIDGIDIAPRS